MTLYHRRSALPGWVHRWRLAQQDVPTPIKLLQRYPPFVWAPTCDMARRIHMTIQDLSANENEFETLTENANDHLTEQDECTARRLISGALGCPAKNPLPRFDYSGVPHELRSVPNWCVWSRDWSEKQQKYTKMPHQCHGGRYGDRAKSNDPHTWATYDEAVRCYQTPGSRAEGIGFQVGTQEQPSGIMFVDLDHCDQLTDGWQHGANAITAFFRTWVERSQSGTGRHLFLRCPVLAHKKVSEEMIGVIAVHDIEVYSYGQFVAMTGDGSGRLAEVTEEQFEPFRLLVENYKQIAQAAAQREDIASIWLGQDVERNQQRRRGNEPREPESEHDLKLAGFLARHLSGDPQAVQMMMLLTDRAFLRDKFTDEHQRYARNSDQEGVINTAFREDIGLTYLEATCGKACRSHQARQAQIEDLAADVGGSDILMTAPLTDAGNAEVFIARYGQTYRYDHTNRCWMAFDGVKWRRYAGRPTEAMKHTIRTRKKLADLIDDKKVAEALRKALDQCESSSRLGGALELTQDHPPIRTDISQFDTHPELLLAKNGVLDLNTGAFRPSTPEDMLTLSAGTRYDPAATCPRWLTFLHEIFDGDEEVIAFIQRAVGYSLTAETKEQCLFLLAGDGQNGKSLFLQVLSALLGDFAKSAKFAALDADDRSGSRETIARIRGARLVTIIEANKDRHLDEATVKSLTGCDEVTGEFKYGHEFSYFPTYKLWLAVNRKPRISGTDNGIWRRMRVIEFTQSFTGKREDQELAGRLLAQLPGILNWALEGLRLWREQGLGMAPSIEKATTEYRQDSNTLLAWLEERTAPAGLSIHTSINAFYADYKDTAKLRGEGIMSLRTFVERLKEQLHEPEYKFDRVSTYVRGDDGQSKQVKVPVVRGLDLLPLTAEDTNLRLRHRGSSDLL